MPYILIKSNGQVIDRRELTGSTVIGRAPDCDITVRDIILSRRHCQLEETRAGWVLIDLQSKNGTAVNGQRVEVSKSVENDDVIRLGRSEIIFRTGMLDEVGLDSIDALMSPDRPANPGDSISGTLSGFTLLLPGESDMPDNMPCPQPQPREPASFREKELQTLLTAIASSSWDSIYAEVKKPSRTSSADMPESEESVPRRRVRPRSPMDLSLQVNPSATPSIDLPDKTPPVRKEMKPLRPLRNIWLQAAVAALWVTIGILLIRHWSQQAGAGPTVQTAMAAPIPSALPASSRQLGFDIPEETNAFPLHTAAPAATTLPSPQLLEDPSLELNPDADPDADDDSETADPSKAAEKIFPDLRTKLQSLNPHSLFPATESAAGYVPMLFW